MKKEKFSLGRLKKIPRNQLLIGGLAGVLLLVIAIPVEKKADIGEGQEQGQEQDAGQGSYEDMGDYAKRMERRLKKILGDMEGVGKVEVMITLKDEGEQLVEKDTSRNSENTQEVSGETTRTNTQHQSQEETVYSSGNDGEPFVAKEVAPCVEGVLVVAEGGGNSQVAKNISDAVLALFPVEVHKIKVVKMN